MTPEEKAERIVEYRALIAGDTAEGQFAKEIAEIVQPKLADDEAHARITFTTANAAILAGELFGTYTVSVSAVEAADAHIAVDWTEHPGGRVGLDAAGNLVRVEFDGPMALDFYGEQA